MAVRTEQYADSISTPHLLHRHWLRHERPIWPFVWCGLVPVLGLLLLGAYAIWPFARNDVEATVLQETRAQLASQGYGWANIAVSGQHVTLSGVQPKAGDGEPVPVWWTPRTACRAEGPNQLFYYKLKIDERRRAVGNRRRANASRGCPRCAGDHSCGQLAYRPQGGCPRPQVHRGGGQASCPQRAA